LHATENTFKQLILGYEVQTFEEIFVLQLGVSGMKWHQKRKANKPTVAWLFKRKKKKFQGSNKHRR
jgi:hypothetical protein